MFQGLFGKTGTEGTPPTGQRQRSSLNRNDTDFAIETPDDADVQKLMVESEEFMKEVSD